MTRALTVALTLALFLPAAARGSITGVDFQPTAADQAMTARACPTAGEAIACWTMSQDPADPFASAATSAGIGWAQCTYLALTLRPDVWNGETGAGDPFAADWDAWTWADHGRQDGLTVDGTPSAGSLAVWAQTPTMPAGHVAYVSQVAGTEAGGVLFTVLEMNVATLDDPAQGQGDTRAVTVPAGDLADGAVQFVHPAGYTPSPMPALAPATIGSRTAARNGSTRPTAVAVKPPRRGARHGRRRRASTGKHHRQIGP